MVTWTVDLRVNYALLEEGQQYAWLAAIDVLAKYWEAEHEKRAEDETIECFADVAGSLRRAAAGEWEE